MKEGTVPVPPTTLALSDDDVAPVRVLSDRGATAAGLKNPLSVVQVIEHFTRVEFLIKGK
jgi:hypothetical protein